MTDPGGSAIDLSQIYLFEWNDWTAYKFNLLTGSYTPVCTDPLCEAHYSAFTDECIFSGVSALQAHGEWLYFITSTSSSSFVNQVPIVVHTASALAYNYITGKVNVLYSVKDSVFQNVTFQRIFEYRDGHIYFMKRAFDPETEDYSLWTLFRVNVNTGRLYEICTTQGEYAGGIGDALLFYDMLSVRGEMTIYKTDMFYQNRVDLVTAQTWAGIVGIYENFIYYNYPIPDRYNGNKTAFARIDIQTGESEFIMELPSMMSYVALIDGWFYYAFGGRTECVIYRINAHGGEPEIFYENPEIGILTMISVNKYLVITPRGGDPSDPSNSNRSNRRNRSNKIVVDTQTGEQIVY
jgi:hypothetical protein